jgi:hypothetical protein
LPLSRGRAAVLVGQSESIGQLLSRWNRFFARYKVASLYTKKTKMGDQTTFQYLSFKPSLNPPPDWVERFLIMAGKGGQRAEQRDSLG